MVYMVKIITAVRAPSSFFFLSPVDKKIRSRVKKEKRSYLFFFSKKLHICFFFFVVVSFLFIIR